ncbi:MAG: ABC-F family ATP-binding cassette domain-containing protein [Clostridia bacterium]|nr:ABC-F family ATP-binding cassette domain-containing protein [Clostridia bacterium]
MAMQLTSVSKSFGVDLILENITMNIADNEKVGLIGANGAGKTTLLRIIAGELPHDSGSIFTPKDAAIGFLKQNAVDDSANTMWEDVMEIFSDITALEEEMRTLEAKMSDASLNEEEHGEVLASYSRASASFDAKGGFEVNTRIKTVLSGMGFDDFDLKNTKVKTLSGGEKTKFAFAKLLLRSPGVLLLDEPTNHLDFKTMQWLEGYLKSYRGMIIAVSHDRYFLDSICDSIYEIERNRATRYPGNYTSYLEEKKKNYEIALKHYEAQQDEIQKLEDYVAKNKVRASTAKMAKSKQKAIDRIEVLEKPVLMNKACRFGFEMEYPSYKDVLLCENLKLMVNGGGIIKTIATGVNIDVKRGEKVAIIGANGVGKSTLLKTLVGYNTTYGGEFEFGRNVELSFYDQEQKLLHDKSTVLSEIWDRFPRMDESEVRTLLGTVLFTDEDVYKEVSRLSGGERARLMLLVIMLEKANTLLLDEPTNHLDLSSKEALDGAVKNFEGTVILVSHDRYFLNKCADKIIELTPHGTFVYSGNYNDYLEYKANSDSDAQKNDDKKKLSSAQEYEAEKRRQANLKNLAKKLSRTEEEIEKLELQNEEIKTAINDAGADYEKVKELYEQSENVEKELNNLYELWNTLSIELESSQ